MLLAAALPSPPPEQDAGSYLVAAWCALQLPVALGAPDAAYRQAASRQVKKKSSERGIELGGLAGGGWDEAEAAAEEGSAYGAHAVTHAERRHLAKQQQQQLAPLAREPAAGSAAADQVGPHEQTRLPLPAGAAPVPALGGTVGQAAGHGRTSPGPPASASSTAALWAAARAAMAEGARATAEGWRYVSSPTNRDVAALVMMKCAAALVWGETGGTVAAAGRRRPWKAMPLSPVRLLLWSLVSLAWHSCCSTYWPPLSSSRLPTHQATAPSPAGAVDILNVRFSEMPEMQALGDASATLGFIFAAGGLGPGRAAAQGKQSPDM